MLDGDSSWMPDPLAGLSGLHGRDLLSFLIEQAPFGVAVLRPQGSGERACDWRYVLANPTYCAMPGTAGAPIVSSQPLMGRTLADVFPGSTAERIADTLRAVWRTGEASRFQEFEALLGPDRERTWWNVSDHPLFDDVGQVAAVLILIHDVTDQVVARRRVEALATEAENERQRLQAVMEALPVGVAITDGRGGGLETNSAYERIWGGPRPDPLSVADYGAYRAWWADTGKPVAPEEWASAQALLKGETVVSQVMEIQRFDGSRAFVLNSAAPVRDAAGKIAGSAVAIQDITRLHQIEEAAESAARFPAENPGPVLRIAEDGRLIYANAASAPVLAVWGSALGQPVPQAWQAVVVETLRSGAERAAPLAIDERIYSMQVVPVPQQRYVNLYGVDDTDRVRAEETLQHALAAAEEASRTLQALMAYVPDGITIADAPDISFRMVSRHLQEMLGWSHEGLTPEEFTRRWPIYGEDGQTPLQEEDLPLVRAIRRGEVVRNVEMVHIDTGGERLHLLANAGPIRDASGSIVGGISVWRDITEMRATRDALRASEQSYRILFETMNEGLALHEMLFDEQGRPCDYRFLEVNPAFERQTGLRASQVLQRTVREVIPKIEPLWIERYGRVVQTGEPTYFEAEAGPLGRWYEVRAFRTQPGHFAALFVDITERRRTEQALRMSEEGLRLANETLEQRVAERTALAEERAAQLRALAVELSRAEERERRRLAGLLHDHLQQLLAAASLQLHIAQPRAAQGAQAPLRQALDLVQQAINASRSLTAELSPVILHDAGLVAALHWLGRWMYQHHGLKVTVTAPEETAGEGLPTEGLSRSALSDEVAAFLFHSTRELLFNVVKHAGVNWATLQLSYPTEDVIQLVVADEGRGYMAEGRAYDDVEAPPTSLGGFGLFSIRERLAYMGGKLTVEGGPGKGTRVTLSLPLPRQGEGAAKPDRQREDGGRDSLPEPYVPRKLRLVVADDHAIVRKGLVGLLNAEPDLQVVGEAGDGWEAIAKVRELDPDVVLMDLNMPRLDGIEVTRRIIAEFPRARVIVLSMFDDSEKKSLMKQLGAADYVAKGGNPASLLAAIRAPYRQGPQEGA